MRLPPPASIASCAAAANMASSSRFARRSIRPRTDPKTGIHFLCLNANIARQFEFIQGAWIANAKFAALTGEQDPAARKPPGVSDVAGRRRSAKDRRLFAAGRPAQLQIFQRAAAIRDGSRRRLFLPARPCRAEMDRERLIFLSMIFSENRLPLFRIMLSSRTASQASARCASRRSSSGGTLQAHHTFACAPGSGCRAGGGPPGSATD